MSFRYNASIHGLVAACCSTLAWGANAGLLAADRPHGPLHKTRSAVMARHGMAATSQPLATAAAIRVLQKGGNAVDAAIAANAVLGRGRADVVRARRRPVRHRLGREDRRSSTASTPAAGRPYAATIELLPAKGLDADPHPRPAELVGPRLRRRLGPAPARGSAREPLADLLAPAIAYAEDGFPGQRDHRRRLAGRRAASSAAIPTSAACFLPGGHAPEAGDVFRNPGLARSLRPIAEGGRDAFYRGPIAEAIVAYSQQVGGLFATAGLRGAHEHLGRARLDELPRLRRLGAPPQRPGDRRPPDAQPAGAVRPQEPWGPHSAEALHLMIEAKKLAYEDRAKLLRRPRVRQGPGRRADLQGVRREAAAADRPRPGQRPARRPASPREADTIYLTVVDKDLNCVSLIQSNFHGFGSYHVPGDLGFPLQNRGCLFALDPTHANRLEPRKRPFHTIIPGFVTKDGKPWLSFGLMGGDMQAQGHVAGALQPDRLRHGRAGGRRRPAVPPLRLVRADRPARRGRRLGRARVGDRRPRSAAPSRPRAITLVTLAAAASAATRRSASTSSAAS